MVGVELSERMGVDCSEQVGVIIGIRNQRDPKQEPWRNAHKPGIKKRWEGEPGETQKRDCDS